MFIPLLVGALGLGFWLAAATTPATVVAPSPTATATTNPTASSSRSLPSQVRAVPVYYVGRQDNKLYRELRDLAATENLVRTAIEAVLNAVPLDHDYESLWGTGRLISSEMTGHNLELNMSPSVFEKLTTPEKAQAAVDQVVYTASELVGDPELRVTFLSDGNPARVAAQRGGVRQKEPWSPCLRCGCRHRRMRPNSRAGRWSSSGRSNRSRLPRS